MASQAGASTGVRWVASDADGLPMKRKQIAQACDICRKRKGRSRKPDAEEDSGPDHTAHPNLRRPSLFGPPNRDVRGEHRWRKRRRSETEVQPETRARREGSSKKRQANLHDNGNEDNDDNSHNNHTNNNDDDDDDAAATEAAATRLVELFSTRFVADINPESIFLQANTGSSVATHRTYRDCNDLGMWLPRNTERAVRGQEEHERDAGSEEAEGIAVAVGRARCGGDRQAGKTAPSSPMHSSGDNMVGPDGVSASISGPGQGSSSGSTIASASASASASALSKSSIPVSTPRLSSSRTADKVAQTTAPPSPSRRRSGGIVGMTSLSSSSAGPGLRLSRAEVVLQYEQAKRSYIEECLRVVPPPEDYAVLHRIYCEKVHPLFPVLNDADLGLKPSLESRPGASSPSSSSSPCPPSSPTSSTSLRDALYPAIVRQVVSLAAAVVDAAAAASHLRLEPDGPLLAPRAFHMGLAGATEALLDADLLPYRFDHVRALVLLGMFYQPAAREVDSSKPALFCMQAVHHFTTLGAHLQGYRPQRPDDTDADAERLFCALWALDRISTTVCARPVSMQPDDMGRDIEACAAQLKPPGFRLLMIVVLLLDRTIQLYRPRQPFVIIDIPIFESLILDAEAEKLPVPLLVTLEMLYHAVCVLSCRQPASSFEEGYSGGVGSGSGSGSVAASASASISTSDTPPDRRHLPPSLINPRRSHSADRIMWLAQTQSVCFFPFVPYAVSLALSVQYKKMRYSRTPMFRTRARACFKDIITLLKGMGDLFLTVRLNAALGESIWRQMEKTATTLAREEEGRGAKGGRGAGSSRERTGRAERNGRKDSADLVGELGEAAHNNGRGKDKTAKAASTTGAATHHHSHHPVDPGASTPVLSTTGRSSSSNQNNNSDNNRANSSSSVPISQLLPASSLAPPLPPDDRPPTLPPPDHYAHAMGNGTGPGPGMLFPAQDYALLHPPLLPQPLPPPLLSPPVPLQSQSQPQLQQHPIMASAGMMPAPIPAAMPDLFESIDSDVDLFGYFDPSFDLGAVDSALEANLDIAAPQNWAPWSQLS